MVPAARYRLTVLLAKPFSRRAMILGFTDPVLSVASSGRDEVIRSRDPTDRGEDIRIAIGRCDGV